MSPITASASDNPALALVRQGWTHLLSERPLAAWASWQRALRVAPDDTAALEALARLESAPDLPAVARQVHRFQPPRTPERREQWDDVLRGRDLEALDDAADAFGEILAGNSEDATAWFNRALCLAWSGNSSEAISCLDQAVRLQAGAEFETAVDAWTIAEILRQGAGAELLADDLRYIWVYEWSGEFDERLLNRPELRRVSSPQELAGENAPVPDARVIEWFDRPWPTTTETARTAEHVPRLVATLIITNDCLRCSSPDPESLEEIPAHLVQALGKHPRLLRREAGPLPLSLLDAAVWTFRLPPDLVPEDAARISREAVEHYYEDLWIHRPRHGLGGLTPLQAGRAASSGDAVAAAKLAAVVRVREQLGARPRAVGLYQGYPFDRLRRRLGLPLENPESVDLADLSCASEAELDRLEVPGMNPDQLAEASRSASGLRDDRRTARFASPLVRSKSPALARVASPTIFAPLVRAAVQSQDPAAALGWLEEARRLASGEDAVIYAIWSAEIHARCGDADAALKTYQALLAEPERDPSWVLSAAEDLLQFGFEEHAAPLLAEARTLARQRGDDATLARIDELAPEA